MAAVRFVKSYFPLHTVLTGSMDWTGTYWKALQFKKEPNIGLIHAAFDIRNANSFCQQQHEHC